MRKGSFRKALCRLWRMGSEFSYPALIQLDYNHDNFVILQFQSMTCPWRSGSATFRARSPDLGSCAAIAFGRPGY